MKEKSICPCYTVGHYFREVLNEYSDPLNEFIGPVNCE